MNTHAPTIERAQPEGYGELRVALATPSMQLNRTTSIEIRDENMALVQRAESGSGVMLAAGLYRVSAVLQDGREHHCIANVEAGVVREVELFSAQAKPSPAGAAMPPPAPVAASPAPSGALPAAGPSPAGALLGGMSRVLARVLGPTEATSGSPPPAAAVEASHVALQALQGAAIVSKNNSGASEWRLRGDGAFETMPNAIVRIGDTAWQISLPVNRHGGGECLLRVDADNGRAPVTAWIAPDRTMVAALQNMLLNGEYAALIPVAQQAIELLRSKYQDPTGAALGALILHKVGGLAPYASWLGNLARDFAWIPDTNVLIASLLVQEHRELDRALQLTLGAASKRMLHAETFSILLDMLRRWPDPAMTEPHRAVIEGIARQCAYVEWSSLFLCHSIKR